MLVVRSNDYFVVAKFSVLMDQFFSLVRKTDCKTSFVLYLETGFNIDAARLMKQSHGLTPSAQARMLRMISDVEALTILVQDGSWKRIMNDAWLVIAVEKVDDQLSYNGSYE